MRPLFYLACAFLSRASASNPPLTDKDYDPFKRIDGLAPLHGLDHPDEVEDHYTVLFHPDNTHDDHFAHIGQDLSDTEHFYLRLNSGYGAYIPDVALLTKIRSDAKVLCVETDIEIFIEDYIVTPTNETSASYEEVYRIPVPAG